MATSQSDEPGSLRGHYLKVDKFLTIAANLLHRSLIENSRTEAKSIYRDLADGKIVPLTHIRMEDGSEVRFDLKLDHSEFRGKLSFSSLRHSVGVLITHIAEAVKDPQSVRSFTNQQNARAVLFGMTAVTLEDGETNVLALGADSSTGHAVTQLQLMYLPMEQFAGGEIPGPEIRA